MNFIRRDNGQRIIAPTMLQCTAGRTIIALAPGTAGAGGLTMRPRAVTPIGTAHFLVLSHTAGRRRLPAGCGQRPPRAERPTPFRAGSTPGRYRSVAFTIS